MLNIVNTLI